VVKTCEVEIVPNKIHYLIEIREYSGREFGGKSKSEKYCTKVALSRIEQGLIQTLNEGDPEGYHPDTRMR
jgi:hypothetical protein